jgi:hypothetical protein
MIEPIDELRSFPYEKVDRTGKELGHGEVFESIGN